MDCKNKKDNLAICTCTWPGCERHGVCCECMQYHRKKGELPACYFPKDVERTYDRSINKFIEVKKNKP